MPGAQELSSESPHVLIGTAASWSQINQDNLVLPGLATAHSPVLSARLSTTRSLSCLLSAALKNTSSHVNTCHGSRSPTELGNSRWQGCREDERIWTLKDEDAVLANCVNTPESHVMSHMITPESHMMTCMNIPQSCMPHVSTPESDMATCVSKSESHITSHEHIWESNDITHEHT